MKNSVIALLLLVSVFILFPAAAQPEDDPQSVLDAIAADYSQSDAALVIQVTTPDNAWTATSGLSRPDQPTAADDRFRIASMSKTYVAVLTLLLAEEGVLSLDDLASKWLPQDILESLANADEVTVRQLLAMRSGVPDYLAMPAFWDTVLEDPFLEWTPQEALTYAYDQPATFAPGEGYEYSNSNYLLVQLVLEEVTGEPLHVLIRDTLLDPLDLKNTYTQIVETLPREFVQSFFDVDGDGTAEEVTNVNDGAGMGDGALVSNASDVTAFYQALLQEQTVLSEESMADLLTFTPDEFGGGYSLGLMEWETDWGSAIGHSGGVIGFSSIGVYVPEQDIIIVILSADMRLDLLTLAQEIGAALLG